MKLWLKWQPLSGRSLRSVLLILLLFFSGCDLFRPAGPVIAEEEYAVMKKILMYSSHYLPLIHVVDRTRTVADCGDMETRLLADDEISDSGPWLGMLNSFTEKNRLPALIDTSALFTWIQYISEEEVSAFERLTDYHEQYPENSGYARLTRPVFNDSGDSAIAEFSFYSAMMNCPSPIRHMYLLVKGEEWNIYRAINYCPPFSESNGSWLEALIDNAENTEGPPYTQAVWSYQYNGTLVYYALSLPGHDYNYFYDSLGTCLGAPDGGWNNLGDGSLRDFFENAQNPELIWVRDVPVIPGASDEYQIMNAGLECIFPRRDYLHLIDSTSAYTDYFSYKYKLDDGSVPYDSLMLEDYLTKNRTPLKLDETYMSNAVHTVPQAELDSLWEQYEYPLDWQEYYRRYPLSNGYIEISRPGIAPQDSMAVMTLGWQFSGDGGQGYMLVFIKINGKWIARWRFETWVS
jgi:hypothetical protein